MNCRSTKWFLTSTDRLKSISRRLHALPSITEQIGNREGDLVKMNIVVNAEPVDALSLIAHRHVAEETRARDVQNA